MTDKKPITSDSAKKSPFGWLASLNGKLTIVVTFFTAMSLFMPAIKSFLWGGDIDVVKQECIEYVDEELQKKQDEGELYLDIVLKDIINLKEYVRNDSTQKRNKEWFAVGLRANKYGVIIYRDQVQAQYPVRANFEKERYEYRDNTGTWVPCYFERP